MGEKSFQLFPDAASSIAGSVDGLYAYMVLVSAFFSLLIAVLVVYFAIKYRRKDDSVPAPVDEHSIGGMILEIVWSVIPLGLSLVMFAWGASIFFTESKPPADAMEVFVTGKQWMWKIQHNEGAREINELHIPINRDIRLTMTSEDVIHDFYVPAFRTKADVLPGRYTTEWFRPTQLGEYHIFCAEYCGTKHSGMIGTVYVMSEPDYNKWLASGSGEGSMAEQGQALFNQLGCGNCHGSSINKNLGRCPNLVGIFGTTVDLKDGSRTRVDESYIRESILYPQAKIVAGYDDIMPTFKGLLTEDGLLKVVEYIRSLGPKNGAPASVPPSPTETTATESTTQPMGNAPQAGPGTQPRTGAKTGNR